MYLDDLDYIDLTQYGSKQAYKVKLPGIALFFSYSTIIAFRGRSSAYRRANTFSRTTGRHFRILGVADLPEVDDTVFLEELNKALAQASNS